MCKPNRFACLVVIIILGVAALVAVAFITIYSTMQNKEIVASGTTDAAKFASEYTEVPKDNVFVYKNSDEIINIIKHGTGVVYIGFPSCPWCQRYAKYLNEVAKDKGIDTIYYYDIADDRKNNTAAYQEIVGLISGFLQYDDEGQPRIYVPDALFIENGNIVANDYESSKDTAGLSDPNEYWTNERVVALKNRLGGYMQAVLDAGGCDSTCNS